MPEPPLPSPGDDLTDWYVKRLEAALQACWDEYHELMPDTLRGQVKRALGIREFTATPMQHNDGSPHGEE
jgi:hypothetical protein